VHKIGEVIAFIKERRDDVVVFVDNCYGEFVEDLEPTHVGADLVAGSLIKNPGGTLAPSGGYVIGKVLPRHSSAVPMRACARTHARTSPRTHAHDVRARVC
jgi:cystathionine beta-lyase family protein involved in aluminum resistance